MRFASRFFVVVAVLALAAPAFSAERLTARSPEAAKRAYWTAFGRPGALPASSAEAADVQVSAIDSGFDVQGALPNQELELTTLIIGPPLDGVPCFNCANGINGSVGSTQSLVRFNRNVIAEMNFFYQAGNYSGPATNAWALVRLPQTVINGGTFNFNIGSPNVIGALEWINVQIPSAATAGDAVLVVRLTGGSNTDTWYQFVKLQ
jgi:hypothetical protein